MQTTPCHTIVQGKNSLTQFMLTAGGRVVRIRHDPSAVSRLMVPTEHELKTILYEQTGAKKTTGDCQRESTDFVALNAQQRKGGRKKQVRKKIARVVGNANMITGQRVCTSGRPPIRHQGTTEDTVYPGLHRATADPRDDESREDEDVSLFLDSFSACSAMAKEYPTSASETATTGTQPPPSSLPTRGEPLERHKREPKAAVFENVQATLAMSEPLAQIDLYRILARAPPADIGSAAAHDPGGSGEERGGSTTIVNSKSHRRETGFFQKVAKSEGRRERRAFQTIGQTARREELGGFSARDPLGEEVAELDAKAQESLRRVRNDAKREKPEPNIDIGRRAALFVEKTKPSHAIQRLVDDDGADEHEERGTNSAAAVAAIVADDDDRAIYTTQHLNQESRAHRRVFNCRRRRRRRKSGGNKEGQARRFESSTTSGVGPLSCEPGNRGGRRNVAMPNYLDEKKHPRELQRPDKRDRKGESEGGLSKKRGVVVKGVTQGEPRAMVETDHESNNKSGRVGADGGWSVWGKRRESDNEQAQPVRANVESTGCTRKGGVQQQLDNSPDDVVERCSSDYGDESFELTDESEAGCLAVAIEETHSSVSRGDAGDVVGDDVGRREEPACSVHGATSEGTLSEEGNAAAAALRIESCWRGHLGRCVAKCALRSELLTTLRNIGGGKISKVLTLADIEREEKQGLNRAIRVATLSRQQLPPQTQIAACIRFVETLQRRRMRAVEARKRRWVAERRQRKESECSYDAHRVPGLLPGFAARATRDPTCST